MSPFEDFFWSMTDSDVDDEVALSDDADEIQDNRDYEIYDEDFSHE